VFRASAGRVETGRPKGLPIDDWGQKRASAPCGVESRTATAAAGREEMVSSGPAWPQGCRAGRSRSWQWSPATSAALRMHRQAQKRPAGGRCVQGGRGRLKAYRSGRNFKGAVAPAGGQAQRRDSGHPQKRYRATESQGPPHEASRQHSRSHGQGDNLSKTLASAFTGLFAAV